MIEIDGPTLQLIQTVIGKTRAGSQVGGTMIDDGDVTQTLPIVPEIVRRSGTPIDSGGWYVGLLRNEHAAASTEQNIFDPYLPGAAAVNGGYPAVVPLDLELWILTASIIRSDGAGTLTSGMLRYGSGGTPRNLGWAELDDGTGIPATTTSPILGLWESLNTGNILDLGIEVGSGIAGPIKIGQRMRRGLVLVFDTIVAGAAADIDLVLSLGLFPTGMGQDILA